PAAGVHARRNAHGDRVTAAGSAGVERETLLSAPHGFQEIELERRLEIGAAHAHAAAALAAAGEEAPHQIVEVAELELLREALRAGPGACAEAAAERLARLARLLGVEAGLERDRTELVVVAPALGVLEHFPGARDLLEALLGGLVARIQVRVMLARELAIGL